MQITRTHLFDAPIDRCWAMFSDPAAHVAKFEGMGHHGVEIVEKKKTKKQFRIVITREVDVDAPGFAKKFIAPRNTVVSTDEWNDNGDGTYGGHYVMDAKGMPVEISGTTLLEPDGGGCLYTVNVDIEVRVPIVGGKLAGFAKGIATTQLDDEFRLGDAWLAR